MDKTGVHSPKNVERAIVSAKDTSSPIQMPQQEKIQARRLKSSLHKILSEKTKEVVREYPNPEPETIDSDLEGSGSDEYNPSMDQFAQDPNEDDDSGMSFDSIALHNLDT
ncbi:hypothetical protein KY289_016303 [Solanum tuberosum]|nr:hypothetical protein KY289_016303 [Solanum tuberosum]